MALLKTWGTDLLAHPDKSYCAFDQEGSMPPVLQQGMDKPIAYDAIAYLFCTGAACLLMYAIILTDMSN